MEKIWTLDKMKKEAKKYKTRGQLKRNNASVYAIALRTGVLDLICTHMVSGRILMSKRMTEHTFDNVLKKAKTCKTKAQFRRKYPKEYNALQKRGIIQDIMTKANFEMEDKCASVGGVSAVSYLNEILGIRLKKAYFLPWLVFKYGKSLTLDDYDPINKVAFEYNGYRHLQDDLKEKDKFKKEVCKKNGIKLIVITEDRYLNRRNLLENIENQSSKEIKRLGLKIKNKNANSKILPNSSGLSVKLIIKSINSCKTRKKFFKKYPKMYNYLNNTGQLELTTSLKRERASIYDPK